MRLPWQRRADEETEHRREVEQHLARIHGQWPRVHAAVAPLRRERILNGWTDHIVNIFASPPSRKDHRA
jgi:hypothetical protein